MSGVDTAAATCFRKIINLSNTRNVKLYFCNVSRENETILHKSGLKFDDVTTFLYRDLDLALEECENNLLREIKNDFDETPFNNYLETVLGRDERIYELIYAMKKSTIEEGKILIHAGENSNDVYIVADGRIKVEVTLRDGKKMRLRSMTRGAIVDEIGHYLKQKRTADIVVEEPATLYCMSSETLSRLEQEHPNLVSLFHRLVAISLSEKMVLANQLISRSKD